MKKNYIKFFKTLPAFIFPFIFAGCGSAVQDALIYGIDSNKPPANVKSVMALVKDVNFVSSKGYTPLMHAAHNSSSPEIIEMLIKEGADVNKGVKGVTPIFMAAYNPNPLIIETLIKNGANPNSTDDNGLAPIHYAVRDNPTPEIITVLKKNGADINKEGFQGLTPLTVAVSTSREDMLLALLKNGANVNQATTKRGITPLMIAAHDAKNPEILEILLNNGANVNAQGHDGWTALMDAVRRPDKGFIEILLKHGADPNIKNKDNSTASDIARCVVRGGCQIISYGLKP